MNDDLILVPKKRLEDLERRVADIESFLGEASAPEPAAPTPAPPTPTEQLVAGLMACRARRRKEEAA